MTTSVQEQLDDLTRRVAAIEHELMPRRAPVTETPARAPWPAPAAHTAPRREPPRPAPPRRELPRLEVSDLLGARALAIAGGVVTLLGVGFFFVLAVDHGWIGHAGRVGLGGAASVLLVLAGIELRRRYGTTHAALAAAGAGIAGAYVTLLAATALYDLVTRPAALALAALVAAIGVLIAIRWKAQLVAAIGLIGAILAPAAIAVQDGVSPIGTGFAALMLAGAVAVSVTRRWRELLVAAVVVSLPQIVVLVSQPEYRGHAPLTVLVAAAAFATVYLAAGVLTQLQLGEKLGPLSSALVFGAALLAGGSAYRLLPTDRAQGLALLGVGLVYGGLTAFFMRRGARNLAALLAAPAFTAAAFSSSALLNGHPLVYAWAAEAAAVAWLARRTKEPRFQYAAYAYAALAFGHLLAFDAPLDELVDPVANHAGSIGPVVAVALGVGLLGRRFVWPAVALAVYALSLATLAVSPSFDWGHVALAAVWGALGLGALAVARTRTAGVVLLSVAGAFVATHASVLTQTAAGASLAVAAASLLPAAIVYDRIGGAQWGRSPFAPIWAVASALLAAAAVHLLVAPHEDWALLALGLVYAAAAAATFGRQRNLTTLLAALASILGTAAVGGLLHGVPRVAAWCALAAGLAWLARRTGESRFLGHAAWFAVFGFAFTFARVAPLTHLFAPAAPRSGWAAPLVVALALAAIAAAGRLRSLWAAAGALTVYGLSIAVLRVAEDVHGASDASFHTGHTLVSAFWGALALGLLIAGLTRWRSLRIAGLALFAVALGKLFLFDLSSLSSLTRALSFLAVGAGLLAGGFLYQRLAVSPGSDTSSGSRSAPPARPSW
jgi:hypothetical protein